MCCTSRRGANGDAFNAISLEPGTGPANPMINAGAIADRRHGETGHERRAGAAESDVRRYTGRELAIDEAVYRSESETGHRNRAIGHMLRNFDILTGDPDGAVDLYFRQCSISVTCRDLAVMAATLANGGVNPVTGVRRCGCRVRRERAQRDGLRAGCTTTQVNGYTGSGCRRRAASRAACIAVLPGQLGIGVFSPRLDAAATASAASRVCEDLSRAYGLHMLSVPNLGSSAIRLSYDATAVRSKRQRAQEAASALSELGSRSRFYELTATWCSLQLNRCHAGCCPAGTPLTSWEWISNTSPAWGMAHCRSSSTWSRC